MGDQLPLGTRIKFTKTLTEAANEDHPDILYAREGESGEIVGYGAKEGYWVKRDQWPHSFGASRDEFVIAGEGMADKPVVLPSLVERLKKCQDMIGNMCSEGRPPKMRVPAEAQDEDCFIVDTCGMAIDLLEGKGRVVCVEAERLQRMEAALEFYAAPESYFGVGIFGDPPCGEFAQDLSICEYPPGVFDYRPGAIAREALAPPIVDALAAGKETGNG